MNVSEGSYHRAAPRPTKKVTENVLSISATPRKIAQNVAGRVGLNSARVAPFVLRPPLLQLLVLGVAFFVLFPPTFYFRAYPAGAIQKYRIIATTGANFNGIYSRGKRGAFFEKAIGAWQHQSFCRTLPDYLIFSSCSKSSYYTICVALKSHPIVHTPNFTDD